MCAIIREPASRVAALLVELRDLADDIVVAADARIERERLADYTSVADRVFRIEFDYLERHLGWLHAQCRGDWILRVDGDEVASPALVELMPELLSRADVHQYLLPRRWLFPDACHWLAEPPWWPDYQVRLVRNDGLLRFPGVIHSSALPGPPAEYLEAPLIHLALIDQDVDHRRSKILRYEAARPKLETHGGGPLPERFYLPERHATSAPLPLDEAEREAVARVLAARAPKRRSARRGVLEDSVVTLREGDRFWGQRTVEGDAYRAEIAPVEHIYRIQAGERRPLYFRVTNHGDEVWPWDAELGPTIRASYRWRHPGGVLVAPDGLRTPFPCSVRPGESVVVPLDVLAPMRPGIYVLDVDVVHEHVRWFECARSVEVEVTARPPARRRGRIRRPLKKGPRLRRTIPRTIHRIWLGDAPLSEDHEVFGETWRRHHPRWEMRMWGDRDLCRLVPREALRRARSPSEASDLLRYEVLRRHGGVYVDTDVECLRPLDPLLDGIRAFAAWEAPHRVGTAVLGSVPGHPAFAEAARESTVTAGLGPHSADSTGPGFLTTVLADHPDVTVFESERFYPYRWDERPRPASAFPDAYAVHHWAGSWVTDNGS